MTTTPGDPTPRPTADDAQDDPFREPENSTVDDWLGQRVQRDEARIDELAAETGGDLEEAQRRYEAESSEADEYRAAHDQDEAPTTESQRKVGES